MYLLPKIHKRLDNVPGRPVISNCGTPTEKASGFLDHHLQPIMKSVLPKLKNLGKYQKMRLLLQLMLLGYTQASPHDEGTSFKKAI